MHRYIYKRMLTDDHTAARDQSVIDGGVMIALDRRLTVLISH